MKKAIGNRPEEVCMDENTHFKFKYYICRCPVPVNYAIKVAPIDEPYQEYLCECEICGSKGVFVG